jgi:hypothetical protein
MAVRVVDKASGQTLTGKFAQIKEGNVLLYSGIMSDKKGGFRGCGKRQVIPLEGVSVDADNPAQELRQS